MTNSISFFKKTSHLFIIILMLFYFDSAQALRTEVNQPVKGHGVKQDNYTQRQHHKGGARHQGRARGYHGGKQHQMKSQRGARRGVGGHRAIRTYHPRRYHQYRGPVHQRYYRAPHRGMRYRYRRYHDADHFRWWIYRGIIPAAALILRYEEGYPVYSCRAKYRGRYYHGTVRRGEPCYINVRGRTVGIYSYSVKTEYSD